MIIAFFAPRIRQSKRSNTPMSKDQGCVCHFSLLSLALTTKFQALQGLLESLTPSPRASLPKSPCGSSDGKAFSSHRGGTRLTQAPISPACAQYFGALVCPPQSLPRLLRLNLFSLDQLQAYSRCILSPRCRSIVDKTGPSHLPPALNLAAFLI